MRYPTCASELLPPPLALCILERYVSWKEMYRPTDSADSYAIHDDMSEICVTYEMYEMCQIYEVYQMYKLREALMRCKRSRRCTGSVMLPTRSTTMHGLREACTRCTTCTGSVMPTRCTTCTGYMKPAQDVPDVQALMPTRSTTCTGSVTPLRNRSTRCRGWPRTQRRV